ncbi:MAG: hypothetical protein LUC99_07710 [Clostridiales bacterium]|nr:hypothetical protein [Clostridiales bacterium]
MIIESIYLKEGLFDKTIKFSSKANLIHSENNSCGKTTLLRFVLYGLGYNIPNTRKIKFNSCDVELFVCLDNGERIKLVRCNAITLVLHTDESQQTFVLPEQENELHSRLFGTQNADILSNLLGAFYLDQEKGWTLLNRGVVIGSIHFNIDSLIRGLSDRDCSELLKKQARLQREKEKYKQMSSVAQYRESLEEESGALATDSYEEESNATLSSLLIRQRQLKTELRRIDKTLSSNNQFKKYVSDMKLLVQSPNGEVFTVTPENIVGMNDSIDILVTKRKMVSTEYAVVSSQVERLEKEASLEYEQLAFYTTASQAEIFDKKILRMPLNAKAIKSEIDRLDKELKSVQEDIDRLTRENNSVIKEISDSIIEYGTELGIGDKDSIPRQYLFTSNLRELSGAILHKTAFAFRLAYITAIEKALNIKLPIILDSPSGKEVDKDNITLMMNILKRDFSDHQIIIASIFTYDFNDLNIIEISERLINETVQF